MPLRKGDELLAHLENLCTKYRVDFSGDLDPSEWPTCHRTALENAKILGDKTYDSYATAPGVAESEPWKVEVKSLACLLVQKAVRHRKRNESTWRHACEPVILGRLESEVCCKNCRKRLWRSDVEVCREGESAAAERLQKRQQAREPCRCPRMARSQDHLEALGLNPIFNYRVDEEVHHKEDIAKILGKGEKPDRVYGLRQTRNIENLLYDGAKRHYQQDDNVEKQVHEVLGLDQPLRQTGDRILFPFLILEAKSADSSYSWHSINMQTAFSIRTFLQTQNLLRSAAGRHSKWRSGPLVWFLANKGEDWRLYAAYLQPAPTTRHTIGSSEYHIVNIWSGSIMTRNGALQLLLLVDYIFDWARDVYREDIIRELRVLANGSNDTASVFYTDPDILSTMPVDTFDQSDERNEGADDFGAFISAKKTFTAIDNPTGVIRHASLVESKYCCVFITRDNVQTLLQSLPQSKVQTFCKEILTHMQTASFITLSALDAIEQQWTGSSRLSSHQLAKTKFYTVMSFTIYISSSWHLIRELFSVAIAEDAWLDVVVASKLKQGRGKTKKPVQVIDLDEALLLHYVKQFQAGSPQQVLHTAISRIAVKIDNNVCGVPRLRRYDGEFRRIVHFVYVSFERGNSEPQEAFLRISRRLDRQHRLNCEAKPLFDELPHVSRGGCVLLTATCYPTIDSSRSKAEFCAYLTSDEPNLPPRQELSAMVLNTFETCDVYHTTRSHWSSVFSPLKAPGKEYKGVWNLELTYGVYTRGFEFLDFIHSLGSEIPVTQGSSRAPSESGAQLYNRVIAPWSDPTLISTDRKARMFVLYKLFSREIQFWRVVAGDRKAQGVSCCRYCAKIQEHDSCGDCKRFLCDPEQYSWLKSCLKGKKPFKVKLLQGSDFQKRLSRSETHRHSLWQHIWNSRYDGPTDDDCDWAWNLDFYGGLEEPFDNIVELYEQWRKYQKLCKDSREWSFRDPDLKRIREEASDDGSEEELNGDSDDPREDLDDDELEDLDDDELEEKDDDDYSEGLTDK